MFTERHYKAIADLLVKTGFNHPQLIEAFCELFDKDNERFKPELFGVSVKRDPWGFPIIPKKKS